MGCYLVLVSAGHWGADEYYVGLYDQRLGWRSAFGRMLHWSPRPASELIGGLYLAVCHLVGRPLVTPFLGLLWLGSVGLVGLAARRSAEQRPLLLGCLLLALALLLERPDEMFYWPMATVAYLPAWAGLAAATLLVRSGVAAPVLLPASLLLAAFSVEMGAATVLVDAMLGLALVRPGTRRAALRSAMLPGLAAMLVCLLTYVGRMRPMSEVLDRASGLADDWPRSLAASVPLFMHQLLGVSGLPVLAGVGVKAAIVLGVRPPAPGGGRRRAIWAAALLLGAFASIVLSLHQFGLLCCQRHQTMRQAMIVLALLALAPSSAGLLRLREGMLGLCVLLLLAVRGPDLSSDMLLLPQEIGAREMTWASARRPGSGMTLVLAPPGRLFGGPSWPLGTVRCCSGSQPAYGLEAIAAFFGKREITVENWK